MSAAQELRMVIAVDDFDRVIAFYRDTVGLAIDSNRTICSKPGG